MKSSWTSIQWLVLLVATNTILCQAVPRRARGVSLPENRRTRALQEGKGKGGKGGKSGKGTSGDGYGTLAPTRDGDGTVAPAQSSYDGDNIFDHETAINTEDQYLAFCQEQLLSDDVAGDGLISQKDIADFAKTLCGILDDEDLTGLSCQTPQAPEFTNLSVEVQLLFVWFICPQGDDLIVISCLADFLTSVKDFGYVQDISAEEDMAADVLGFCCSLIPVLAGANLETLTGEFRFLSVVHLHALHLRSISHPA
jgi:hypothetical protein